MPSILCHLLQASLSSKFHGSSNQLTKYLLPCITTPLFSSPSVCPRCVLQRLSSSLEQQLGVAKVRRNPIDVSFHPISQYFVPFLPPRHPSPNAKHVRAALQGPPCVSLARDVLECWGLNASQKVKRLGSVISAAIIFEVGGVQVTVRVIAAPLPILRAVLEPVAPRDWEVLPITRRHVTRHTSRITHHHA